MRRGGLLAVAVLASWMASKAAAVQPGVRGMVYGDDRDDPVAGALVVLYDSDDLMVDSAYTRDDGGFTLRPPQRKGTAYVVATLGSRARREAIDYDPARSKAVWIPLPAKRESRLKQAADWVLGKLGAVIGLLVGYGFRVLVEERGAAKRKRDDFLFDLRDLAGRALAPYAENPAQPNLAAIAAAVGRIRQLVDRRSDIPDALSTLKLVKKAEGRASFKALDDRLARTETLLAQAPQLADVARENNLGQARANLQEIRDRPLG
jgi:hypothetical protein